MNVVVRDAVVLKLTEAVTLWTRRALVSLAVNAVLGLVIIAGVIVLMVKR